MLPNCIKDRGSNKWGEHNFLRSQLLYQNKFFYGFCIVLDLILRFLWVTSLMPRESLTKVFGPMFGIFLGSFEIIRRFMWGILRTEWEHWKLAKSQKLGFRHSSVNNELLRDTSYRMNFRMSSADTVEWDSATNKGSKPPVDHIVV